MLVYYSQKIFHHYFQTEFLYFNIITRITLIKLTDTNQLSEAINKLGMAQSTYTCNKRTLLLVLVLEVLFRFFNTI